MPVEIDLSGSNIPGLPNKMEVKNAAEEATLQELLDLFKKTNKVEEAQLKALNKLANIKEKAKDEKPDPKKQAAEKKETQSALNVAKANMQSATVSQRLGQSLGSMARSAGVVTKGVTNFGYAAANAAKEVLEITAAASQMVGEFARMQDSITAATSSLRRIPFFGTALAGALGPAADAAERTYQEFTKLSMSGATFGGSFNDMITAATGAGLTMEQFNNIVSQNGQAMMALGGTTEQGAKRFAQMGKEMRQSQIGTELLRLGFTTQEVNSGMASYINVIRGTGKAQNLSTTELAEQSGRYMKNLQVLAKMTGETVEQKKKEAEALAKDVQLKAAIQDLSAEEQTQMINMINSYPEAHRTAIKDMIATGSITTEEGRKFAAMYPKAAADFRGYNRVIKQGQAVSQKVMNQTYDAMIDEGKARFKGSRSLFQFSRDYDQTAQGMMEMNDRQKTSQQKAAAEQEKIAKEGGATAEQIAKFKQRVASVSNEMTKGLISTSALAAMETAFMGLANFTQQFVVPALRVMFDVIGYVVNIVGSVLSPIFATLGFVVDAIAEGLNVLKPIIDIVMGAFSVVGKVLGTVLVPVIIGVGAILAVAFAPVIAKIALIVGAIGLLNKVFSGIGDTVKDVADGFMDAIDAVRSYLPAWLGGLSEDEAKERKARRESGRQEREERKKSADAIKKETDARKTTSTDKGMDWSGPAAMLKSFGEATGSVYAKNAAEEEKRLENENERKKKALGIRSKEDEKAAIERNKKLLEYSRSEKDENERKKKATAKIRSEEKAAADEKIKYTINGKEATKEEYEAQRRGIEAMSKDMGLMATAKPTPAKDSAAEKPGFFSTLWDNLFGDSKKSIDQVKKAEKAAAEEKIKYTVNGRKVTKEEYEAQRRGMDAWGKSLGLNLDSVSASQKSAADEILEKNAESKEGAGMSAGTKGGLAGAGVGMLFGGPIGAVIGGFIGNRIAKVLEKKPGEKPEEEAAETLPDALSSTTQALITMRDKGLKPFTTDLKKFRQELSGEDIELGFEDVSSTINNLFTNPFVAKGGGAGGAKAAGGAAGGGGGGGAGGGASGGAGGGAGGGGAGIGAVSGGGKLPTVSDKQGKTPPGDEEMVGDVGQFVKTPSGADLSGLESGTKKRLAGLAQEYFNATGEKIQINTAFRSYEDQMALFQKYGSPRAARPGRSKHEVGLAFDMQSAHANKAIQMGLFSKYGFHRPVAGETWHIEPVEARGGVPDNPVAPGQEVMVASAGKPVTPDSGKPQAAKGGILSGPKSGFDATLHGTEAVVPLPDGKGIPVEISGLSTDSLISTIAELTAKLEFLTGGNIVDVEQNFSGSFLAEITKMVDKIGMATTEAHNRGVDLASAINIKPLQTLDELSKNMLAAGGITSGASIAGEAGPEAVVPLPDGRTIPVTIVGGGDQNAMVDLLTALNTKMDQLVFINSMLADIGNNQLKVQKNIGHPDLLIG